MLNISEIYRHRCHFHLHQHNKHTRAPTQWDCHSERLLVAPLHWWFKWVAVLRTPHVAAVAYKCLHIHTQTCILFYLFLLGEIFFLSFFATELCWTALLALSCHLALRPIAPSIVSRNSHICRCVYHAALRCVARRSPAATDDYLRATFVWLW